ncbi:hypothetical protein AGABI1DRAFT_63345 [Agaricus bisporus var. burnettii JB137-S8]|uniref:Fumarylacetoacetase-like C-terminal domain-containing protein n=2 Tax=Agaricus bisporus var. burnettii TaxID=192524 RepID=K5XNQ7_AGABU|nr:uncharacterized protein AGABI1DRAFT_63345 [Agaricus bisporus var. burnettii JB137-S8]EKM76295.1 hypothetical protein AGABI1DRAFT_63345 [Agaricus bisporus var. burnettii JB137-S8]
MLFSPLLLLLPFAVSAQRFVRFISDDGKEYTGDAILPDNTIDASMSTQARVVEGDILGDFYVTDKVKIQQLLSPLSPERTRTVRCVGFNYVEHNEGTNTTLPEFPILFFKPFTALSDPGADVPVTPGYQQVGDFLSTMDYEAELVVVIGKKAFNISEAEALDVVAGYSIGNDVSHRGWQVDRGGQPRPQFSMGKGADGWAPWGPALVHPSIIEDPQTLKIWSKVNGELKQNSTTANMIFGVKQIVSFFSMGITLMPGDVIFTGTPAGTQFESDDPIWLTDGDVVEVGLDNVGTITNTYRHVNLM